jgi:hypothetical protein
MSRPFLDRKSWGFRLGFIRGGMKLLSSFRRFEIWFDNSSPAHCMGRDSRDTGLPFAARVIRAAQLFRAPRAGQYTKQKLTCYRKYERAHTVSVSDQPFQLAAPRFDTIRGAHSLGSEGITIRCPEFQSEYRHSVSTAIGCPRGDMRNSLSLAAGSKADPGLGYFLRVRSRLNKAMDGFKYRSSRGRKTARLGHRNDHLPRSRRLQIAGQIVRA